MTARTDLAIEFQKNAEKEIIKEQNFGEIKAFFTELNDNNPYGKRKGKYATIKVGNIDLLPDFEDVEKALLFCLCELLPTFRENILVVGLGNREITSDNIGPNTASKILATRHIKGQFQAIEGFEKMKSVSVITPSVLGKTGIEASEIVSSLVKKIKPDAVIVIDALCANDTQNLFSVIQLCNSGISPGSGVKNTRKELSETTLGVPTVAIGVPTVVEAAVIAKELTGKKAEQKTDLLVTPKDADLLSLRMSEAISAALNVFLQPEIEPEIVLSLV
ncbi:MAG: GPR endopeptidase [Clostridia bacterium]|nr:GPR endopeptidase [Clostridia bacterium]